MNIGNNLVALQYHEQALRMRESKLGADHVDVAATKDNMGLVYRQLNQLDMALKVSNQLGMALKVAPATPPPAAQRQPRRQPRRRSGRAAHAIQGPVARGGRGARSRGALRRGHGACPAGRGGGARRALRREAQRALRREPARFVARGRAGAAGGAHREGPLRSGYTACSSGRACSEGPLRSGGRRHAGPWKGR
jgi:hypothetical protein